MIKMQLFDASVRLHARGNVHDSRKTGGHVTALAPAPGEASVLAAKSDLPLSLQAGQLQRLPEVSIILPTCDRPALVGRALASLLAQTFADIEVLLVDNNRRTAATRTNPQLAPLLADTRVRVLDGRTARSAATARNLGLETARGDWIAFLDDDDEYRPDKIAAQYALATTTRPPLVLCGYEFVWPRRRRVRQVRRARFVGDTLLTHAQLGTPLLFHRRDDMLRFDTRLAAGEDVPYALQFLERHGVREVPCVQRALVVVHPQPAGASVHADKEAVWRAYRATWPLVRGRFSRRARRAWLAQGRLERAIGGYGGTAQFMRRVLAMLRTRGLREWRFALHALLARHRRSPSPAPCPPTPN